MPGQGLPLRGDLNEVYTHFKDLDQFLHCGFFFSTDRALLLLPPLVCGNSSEKGASRRTPGPVPPLQPLQWWRTVGYAGESHWFVSLNHSWQQLFRVSNLLALVKCRMLFGLMGFILLFLQKSTASYQRSAFQSPIARRPHAGWTTSLITKCVSVFHSQLIWSKSHSCAAFNDFLSSPSSQLREYCQMLRNMVASEATKSEISDAMDTMMEEVSQ